MNTLRWMIVAAALTVPGAASAETVRVKSTVPVEKAVANMTTAIKAAGWRVFTMVDYAKGSAAVGYTLRPTTLIVFGSPKIGGDAVLTGQTMGLYLPLKVLAYEDEAGASWLIYKDPKAAATEHGIPADHPGVANMVKALKAVTSKGSGNN